jgi:hypothetical protein
MAPIAILSLKYMAAPNASVARSAVGGFLRYIQYRDDHHNLAEKTSRVLGYVGFRDRTSAGGQLFDANGRAGDLERKALVAHVRRSLRDIGPQARPQRAVYRFVVSPADARGLDLRELARATMRGLENDAGPLPPWIAAVHRNTQHPHVHIVLAARREIAPDRFRTLIITRPRLARMKETVGLEIARQRGRSLDREPTGLGGLGRLVRLERGVDGLHLPAAIRPRRSHRSQALLDLGSRLRTAARRYQRQMEHELLEEERRRNRELEWER